MILVILNVQNARSNIFVDTFSKIVVVKCQVVLSCTSNSTKSFLQLLCTPKRFASLQCAKQFSNLCGSVKAMTSCWQQLLTNSDARESKSDNNPTIPIVFGAFAKNKEQKPFIELIEAVHKNAFNSPGLIKRNRNCKYSSF